MHLESKGNSNSHYKSTHWHYIYTLFLINTFCRAELKHQIYKFYDFEIYILSYVIWKLISFKNISNNTTHDIVLKHVTWIIIKIQYKTFFTFSISSSEKVAFCIYGVLFGTSALYAAVPPVGHSWCILYARFFCRHAACNMNH